jgi:hypothetical protein
VGKHLPLARIVRLLAATKKAQVAPNHTRRHIEPRRWHIHQHIERSRHTICAAQAVIKASEQVLIALLSQIGV